jgi:AraC family transcriptional regulator
MINLSNGQYLGSNKLSYDAGGIILTETEYHNTVFEGWHRHENIHISLIIKGGNREERKRSDTAVLPGALLFYRPDELHRNLHTSHPSKNINLEISPAFLAEHDLQDADLQTLIENPMDARLTMLQMYQEALRAEDLSKESLHMLFWQLIVQTSASYRVPEPNWVGRVRELLHDNWDSQPSLQELALASGAHPVTISKQFTRYFGCTLGTYMRKLKVDHAVLMIKNSKLPLTEVAYVCGFADQSHFIRAFKKLTAFLPKAYQRF